MGMKISERFENRCEIFREILLMIEETTNGICYLALPIDEIFIEIDNRGICKKLKFLTSFKKLIDDGEDFPCAWSKSIYGTYMSLRNNETEKLIAMGLSLGRTASESQKSILRFYSAQFKRCAEEAYEQRKKYYFPCKVSGFLFGGAVFILLV